MRNQQTNQDVLNLLNNGGIVTIRLTGVNADNRQNTINQMMNLKCNRNLEFYAEPDNEYDEFAISVSNSKGEEIGFIPKSKNFSITLPKRRRPISFGGDIINNETGDEMQTNEIFYDAIQHNLITGCISKFLNYGTDNKIPIGVEIQFQLKQPLK